MSDVDWKAAFALLRAGRDTEDMRLDEAHRILEASGINPHNAIHAARLAAFPIGLVIEQDGVPYLCLTGAHESPPDDAM